MSEKEPPAQALWLKDEVTTYYMATFFDKAYVAANFFEYPELNNMIIDLRYLHPYKDIRMVGQIPVISFRQSFDSAEEFLTFVNQYSHELGFNGRIKITEHLSQTPGESLEQFLQRVQKRMNDFILKSPRIIN